MYALERQKLILERIRGNGRVSALALAREFDLSTETIRRDLVALESAGALRRVHGGAVARHVILDETPMAQRRQTDPEQKARIADAALAELPQAGVVFLESASTSIFLAERLPVGRDLTVVTNGIPIANLLGHREDLSVLMIGGRIRARSMATMDDWALSSLDLLQADVAFLGTLAFSPERGLMTSDTADAAIKRRVLQVARRNVLLAEASKCGDVAMCRYGEFADLDLLITDDRLDDESTDAIRDQGVDIVRV